MKETPLAKISEHSGDKKMIDVTAMYVCNMTCQIFEIEKCYSATRHVLGKIKFSYYATYFKCQNGYTDLNIVVV